MWRPSLMFWHSPSPCPAYKIKKSHELNSKQQENTLVYYWDILNVTLPHWQVLCWESWPNLPHYSHLSCRKRPRKWAGPLTMYSTLSPESTCTGNPSKSVGHWKLNVVDIQRRLIVFQSCWCQCKSWLCDKNRGLARRSPQTRVAFNFIFSILLDAKSSINNRDLTFSL